MDVDRHLRADAAPQDQGSRPLVRRARRSRRSPRTLQAADSSSSSSRRPIRARPTKSCSRCSRRTGLKADVDFFLAFSPERVDPGQPAVHDEEHSRRSSAASGPTSTEAACALYARDRRRRVVPVSSTRVAEMVKLLENTFRAVNIGLVNEIALMCHKMDIDVWEVIDAAKTKPFGFMPFYPGPGLGGHCIPIDPFYLSWKARQNGFECRFIELAGQVNALDARVRRRARRRRAEHASRSRSTDRASTCSASPTSATSTTCASRRRSTFSSCCASAARELSYTDPCVPQLTLRRPHAVVDRSGGGARAAARLRGHLHRSHRHRLRRARAQRHAGRRHAQRAQGPSATRRFSGCDRGGHARRPAEAQGLAWKSRRDTL